MIRAKVKAIPTDSPNMAPQVQEFFTRDISEPQTIPKSLGNKPI